MSSCRLRLSIAYVLSPGGQQLAVYHGRQVSESSCIPNGFGQYERRVHIYPVEFRSYGPDGINIIFERNANGVMTKRFVTTNNQGSIVSVTDNAGYEASAVYDNYGAPSAGYTRRTGWLDRERDFETSPLSTKHKLYDLEARKYNASTGQFLSVDPLWMYYLSSGSYVYCEGDPVNMVDPWGLGGQGGVTSGGTGTPGPFIGPPRPAMVEEGMEPWFQQAIADAWARAGGIGFPIYPGMTLGANPTPMMGIAPPRGIGPGGKGGNWPNGFVPAQSNELRAVGFYGYTSLSDPSVAGEIPTISMRELTITGNRPDPQWWVIVNSISTVIALVNGVSSGIIDGATHVGAFLASDPMVTRYLSISRRLGLGGAVLGIGYTGYRFAQTPTLGSFVRLLVQGAIMAATFFPPYGWGVAAALTGLDFLWGDDFYNALDSLLK